jgi:hypothetical protein
MESFVSFNPFPFLFMIVGAVALFAWLAVASWTDARRREREAYYRSEVLKKIAESQGGGANAALEIMREEERIKARRTREAPKRGGLVMIAVGLGLAVMLRGLVPDKPVYLVGAIPFLVGAAMLLYAFVLAPKD